MLLRRTRKVAWFANRKNKIEPSRGCNEKNLAASWGFMTRSVQTFERKGMDKELEVIPQLFLKSTAFPHGVVLVARSYRRMAAVRLQPNTTQNTPIFAKGSGLEETSPMNNQASA
jgi:hypothetical protein